MADRDTQTDAGRTGGTQTKAAMARDAQWKPAKGDFKPGHG